MWRVRGGNKGGFETRPCLPDDEYKKCGKWIRVNEKKIRVNPQIKKINADEKRRKFLARRRGREERLIGRKVNKGGLER